MAEPAASAPYGTPDQRRAGAQSWPRLTKGREGGLVNPLCSKSAHAQKGKREGIIPFALHGIVFNDYRFFGRLSPMICGADHVKL